MKYLKPNIFISSTVKDLPNEREAVKRAVEKLQAISVMSEFTMNAVNVCHGDRGIDMTHHSGIF